MRQRLGIVAVGSKARAFDNPLQIELRYNTSDAQQRLALAIQAMWKDVLGVDTIVIARTDALGASLITSDVDERDREFVTGERTSEGFFTVKNGMDADMWEALKEDCADRYPMGRVGQPIDVANCALFLASAGSGKTRTIVATLANAVERFLGRSREEIYHIAKETLEGNLRGVLASLTPEEVNDPEINSTYYDWVPTWKLVRDLQPGCIRFSDGGPDIRWVGNERGYAGETCWATYTPTARDDETIDRRCESWSLIHDQPVETRSRAERPICSRSSGSSYRVWSASASRWSRSPRTSPSVA